MLLDVRAMDLTGFGVMDWFTLGCVGKTGVNFGDCLEGFFGF